MSISLQNTLRERKWFGYNLPRRQSFEKRFYADSYTINHMSQERELGGHSGCVNTLDWSLSGDKLLTGSDDTHLCVYDSYNDYKISQVIHTGHRANIFSAKFMPQTSEKRIVSCAGDSEIRVFDNGEPIQMYVCHHDQTKRICVYHDNPNEFLTCSQDGTVRHFDLRVPHICTPHNVKSFMTSELKPAKQTIVDPDARKGCSKPIVDYSRYSVELNGMSINQRAPHYFAVAGTSNFIYLHDRRMMGSPSVSSSSTKNIMEGTRCVKRFTSGHNDRWSNNHITACQFAKSNSEELIGSWSSDAIYLFNINDDSPVESSSRRKNNSSTFSRTIPAIRRNNVSFTQEWIEITRLIKEHKMDEVAQKLDSLHTNEYSPAIKIIIKCVSALCSLYSYNRNYDMDDDVMALDKYILDANRSMENAQEEQRKNPDSWYCKWYLSVGYFLACGGPTSFCDAVREAFLRKSLDYLQQAMAHPDDNGHTSTMASFRSDLKDVCIRVGCWPYADDNSNHEDEIIDEEEREDEDINNNSNFNNNNVNNDDNGIVSSDVQWKWLDYLYIDTDMNNNDEGMSTTEEDENEDDDEEDEDDTMLSDSSTQSDHEDDISMYTEIFSSRGIRDIIEVSDSSDVESDFEAYRGYGISNRNLINENVTVVKSRSKYKGHCNIETIKDVDFFGPNDEYILSGSDGGDLFIWDKKTTKILQILHADNEIVNVAKGHPTLPILAVSGIDSTAKIFSPMTRPLTKSKLTEPNESLSYSASSRMFVQEEITRMNEENNENLEDHMNITRNMIAVLTHFQRTYRRRQRSESDQSLDHSEEDT